MKGMLFLLFDVNEESINKHASKKRQGRIAGRSAYHFNVNLKVTDCVKIDSV